MKKLIAVIAFLFAIPLYAGPPKPLPNAFGHVHLTADEQGFSGITLQFQNAGSIIGTFGGGLVTFNCSTNTSCSLSGSTITMTATNTGATAFSAITAATNTNALVMGTGGSLGTSGSGTIAATSLEAKTWEAPGTIGSTTPNTGAFTTVSLTGQLTSTLATGTAPFSVTSTTPVANLSIGGNAATATNATGLQFGTTPIPMSSTAPTANQCLAADATASNIIGTTCGTGGSGLSGMTAGQIPVAATATTVTSSLPLAGGGTQVMKGTISSNPTNGFDILGLNASGVLVNETPGITGTDQAGTTYTIQTTDIGTTFNVGNSAGVTVTVPDAGTCSNGTLSPCTSGGSAFSAHPYFTVINNNSGSDTFSSATLAAPAAPSVSAGGSGGPGAATYITYVTYINPQGETVVSSSTSQATSAGQVITVTSPAASGNASGYNVYSTTGAAGTETRQNASPINIGTNWTEPNTGLISGAAIPSSNTTNSLFIVGNTAGASSYTLPAGERAVFASLNNISWYVLPTVGSGVSVNGAVITGLNLNATTPAAPANTQNAVFNVSGVNAAVELPQATTGQAGLVELANSLGGTDALPTVLALDFGATHLALGTAPTTNQCLSYNGTNITGATCSGGAAGGTVTYTAAQTASSSDNGKLVIMNCSSACAYTLPNPSPSTTWFARVTSIGSTLATVALQSGATINAGSTVPILNNETLVPIYADSVTNTNYDVQLPTTLYLYGSGAILRSATNSITIQAAGSNAFVANPSGANFNETLGNNAGGFTNLNIGFAANNGGEQQAYYTELTNTGAGALTAGQVVKQDTANAHGVIVATTTDTAAGAALGFLVNSPAANGLAQIAVPGSIITTPLLGTGTCSIGNFVIVDTTTNGDVKCTATFSAGTTLGRAITAQSTVGSAVSVYVDPM